MLHFALVIIMVIPIYSIYQSNIQFSSTGLQYQPYSSIQLLSTTTARSKLVCSATCNQLSSCRIFDYDTVSKQCRSFEGDTTTGSIISSSSPTSVVGTIRISSNLYSSMHNYSCQACQYNRYEICSTNTSTCKCPAHTYWTGSVCALQFFQNETCDLVNSCRSDLNLSCLLDCYGKTQTCLPSTTYSKNKIFFVFLIILRKIYMRENEKVCI